MNILSLNYEFPPLGGGGGYVTKAINETLVKKGFSVDLITMHYRGLKREEVINGVRVFRVRSLRKKQETCETAEMMTYVVSAIPFAMRLTKKNSYDLIHSHFVIPTSPIAYVLKKFRGLNYIITVHGSDIPGYNPDRFKFEHKFTTPFLRPIMKNAGMIIPLSGYLKDLIEGNISSDLPLTVIPNGMEPDRFRIDLPRLNRMLMTGRLLPRKGFQHTLEALKDVSLPGWEIHIAGDGPYRKRLETLARESKNKIIFHGWLPKDSEELRDLYERSKIFILPSDVENAPIALLEAMNAGLAVITTNTTGCKEVAGDSGLLVNPRDTAGIKTAILKLVRDDGLIKEMGEKARRRSIECFSWDSIVDRYIEMYKMCAGS